MSRAIKLAMAAMKLAPTVIDLVAMIISALGRSKNPETAAKRCLDELDRLERFDKAMERMYQ